jgi:hypothetical protein
VSETYARLMAMAEEAKVPGKTATERMKYVVDLFERNGLGITSQEARKPAKHPGHC